MSSAEPSLGDGGSNGATDVDNNLTDKPTKLKGKLLGYHYSLDNNLTDKPTKPKGNRA